MEVYVDSLVAEGKNKYPTDLTKSLNLTKEYNLINLSGDYKAGKCGVKVWTSIDAGFIPCLKPD
jgi:hypothetical protein